jgi:aquaporin NIP
MSSPPSSAKPGATSRSSVPDSAASQARAHLAEFIGTFALVFAGCGAVALGSLSPVGVAAAFGLVITVMIYALGHISGAHFNPAVSIGFAIGGHFPWSRVVTYAVAQIGGAIAAAVLLRVTLGPNVDLGVTHSTTSDVVTLVWEAVLTFFLMLVITAVATDARAVGQSAALAIGGAVALGSLVGGPLTGASMNPARSWVQSPQRRSTRSCGAIGRPSRDRPADVGATHGRVICPTSAGASLSRLPSGRAPGSPAGMSSGRCRSRRQGIGRGGRARRRVLHRG